MYRVLERLHETREPQLMTIPRADPGGRRLRAPGPLSITRALTHVVETTLVGDRWNRAYRTRISATDAATIAFAKGELSSAQNCAVHNRVPHIEDWTSD
jgi:hypothetical protein